MKTHKPEIVSITPWNELCHVDTHECQDCSAGAPSREYWCDYYTEPAALSGTKSKHLEQIITTKIPLGRRTLCPTSQETPIYQGIDAKCVEHSEDKNNRPGSCRVWPCVYLTRPAVCDAGQEAKEGFTLQHWFHLQSPTVRFSVRTVELSKILFKGPRSKQAKLIFKRLPSVLMNSFGQHFTLGL